MPTGTYHLIRRVLPNFSANIILDIGANKGETVKASRQFFPQAVIHAFEPVPSLFHQLEKSSAGLNVRSHNVAMGRSSGTVKMTAEANSTMNRVQLIASPGMIDVPITTVDQFCETHDIAKIDFLKVDTEGFDLEVLAGAPKMLKKTSFVQCEVSANPHNKFHIDFRLVFDHMIRSNFYLFHVMDQSMEWTHGGRPILRRFDAVFVNGEIAGDMSQFN